MIFKEYYHLYNEYNYAPVIGFWLVWLFWTNCCCCWFNLCCCRNCCCCCWYKFCWYWYCCWLNAFIFCGGWGGVWYKFVKGCGYTTGWVTGLGGSFENYKSNILKLLFLVFCSTLVYWLGLVGDDTDISYYYFWTTFFWILLA